MKLSTTWRGLRSACIACCLAGAAAAAPSLPALDRHDGQHDFDAGMGEWKVHVAVLRQPLSGQQAWVEYDGTHQVQPIWNGRGSVGVLDVAGPAGRIEAMSPRLYNPATRQWTIRYASGRDGAMGPPLTGQFSGSRGMFIGEDAVDGRLVLVRNTYTDIGPGQDRFESAFSGDGGVTWETSWVMTGTRMQAGPASGAIIPDHLGAAVADAARPPADTAIDTQRKPAQLLAFAGVRPGDKVADLMPGAGYFTRLFSTAVGAKGAVYALQPLEMDKAAPDSTRSLRSFAGSAAYANVQLLLQPAGAIAPPADLDLAWTSMNYHDLHDPFMGQPDIARFNRSVFEHLRPGGVFLVIDHAAAGGSGLAHTDDLHRIDPAAVKAEVMAAGFEFAGESEVLANPADDRSTPSFGPAFRGKTDRFVFKFRKPGGPQARPD
jgi:predicted methyltransferase